MAMVVPLRSVDPAFPLPIILLSEQTRRGGE